jgi:hypothetical protein
MSAGFDGSQFCARVLVSTKGDDLNVVANLELLSTHPFARVVGVCDDNNITHAPVCDRHTRRLLQILFQT